MTVEIQNTNNCLQIIPFLLIILRWNVWQGYKATYDGCVSCLARAFGYFWALVIPSSVIRVALKPECDGTQIFKRYRYRYFFPVPNIPDTDTDTFFRYQFLPIQIPILFSGTKYFWYRYRYFFGTKFFRYRFRDFFPIPNFTDTGSVGFLLSERTSGVSPVIFSPKLVNILASPWNVGGGSIPAQRWMQIVIMYLAVLSGPKGGQGPNLHTQCVQVQGVDVGGVQIYSVVGDAPVQTVGHFKHAPSSFPCPCSCHWSYQNCFLVLLWLSTVFRVKTSIFNKHSA